MILSRKQTVTIGVLFVVLAAMGFMNIRLARQLDWLRKGTPQRRIPRDKSLRKPVLLTGRLPHIDPRSDPLAPVRPPETPAASARKPSSRPPPSREPRKTYESPESDVILVQ